MTYCLGLTGSIGMGKSTTAQMFADEGVPVWDADASVHRLYEPHGQATGFVRQLYPDVIENGAVSRSRLRQKITTDPSVLDTLQALVHPLVAADRALFLSVTQAPIAVLDIPLLFETGADAQCDGTVVVSAAGAVQRQRVLSRGEMTAADLDLILSRQMPDAEKRARADWVIETRSFDFARAEVRAILMEIRQRIANARDSS